MLMQIKKTFDMDKDYGAFKQDDQDSLEPIKIGLVTQVLLFPIAGIMLAGGIMIFEILTRTVTKP